MSTTGPGADRHSLLWYLGWKYIGTSLVRYTYPEEQARFGLEGASMTLIGSRVGVDTHGQPFS